MTDIAFPDDSLQSGQLAELARGTQEVLTHQDLVRKLARGKPLKVKAGFDPVSGRNESSSKYRHMSSSLIDMSLPNIVSALSVMPM